MKYLYLFPVMMTPLDTAIKIVNTLRMNGHTAYFAGGWVRDHLLGIDSIDIDIATSAKPAEIQSFFEKTYPVGVSFGVIIVRLNEFNFEVATFRSEDNYTDGRHPNEITFSDPKNDALRRDFTINGMFYDPIEKKVYDYVNGQRDLKNKIINAIGNPIERFEEDRLRMLRAVRFASTLGFEIDPSTFNAIKEKASSLFPAVSVERVWQELNKMAKGKNFSSAIKTLEELNLLQEILPSGTLAPSESKALEKASVSSHPVFCFLFLYAGLDLELCIEIASHFKLSNKEERDLKDALKFIKTKQSAPHHIWAKLYSHPLSNLHIDLSKQLASHSKGHQKRIDLLAPYIERLRNKEPLIGSKDLIALGVKPGKKMGEIMNLAFEISCDQLITDKGILISLIKDKI